jgi:hypothetical protein
MAGLTHAAPTGRPEAGWLLTHADGVIVTADETAAELLRAPAPSALVGRSWPSLVALPDRGSADAARDCAARGEPWSGTLRFLFGFEPSPLHLELTPASGDPDPMVVMHVQAAPALEQYAPSAEDSGTDTAALVMALDAEGALADDAAATYAVLQALTRLVRFEWAAVLRFDSAAAAQVIGVFPTPMGGVGPGAVWSPLDADEAALVTTREPQLDVELGRSPGSPSPLERMPAFGLTSRLMIPLFEGATVVGAVVCYAPTHTPFEAIDGLRVERFARRLGQRLGQRGGPPAEPGTTTPAAGAPPAPVGEPAVDAPTLDAVVAEVAHQLNNPLTSILGYAQLLPSLAEDDRTAALATIEQEAERAARLVRNLLAFGREQPGAGLEALGDAAEIRRVLVASPDPPLLTLATEVLTAGGYAADTVSTVEGTLELARSGGYVAFVLDANLEAGGADIELLLDTEAPALAARTVLVSGDPERARPGRPTVSRAQLSAALLDAVAALEEA